MEPVKSIFDLFSDTGKMWSKTLPGDEQSFKNANTLFSSYGKKISSSRDSKELRFFSIKNKILFYTKGPFDHKIRSYLDLRWSRLDHSSLEGGGAIFTLIKARKFTRIFVENREDAARWKAALRSICILSKFNQDFKVVDKICENVSLQIFFKKIDYFY